MGMTEAEIARQGSDVNGDEFSAASRSKQGPPGGATMIGRE
jgi:hypothetical protein